MRLDGRLTKLEAESRNRGMIVGVLWPHEDENEVEARLRLEHGINANDDCLLILVQKFTYPEHFRDAEITN